MNAKLIALLFFVLCLLPLVNALGVARPFFEDNTLEIEPNETAVVKFQLQNMESEEKKLVLKISSQHTMEIEGGDFYEKQFVLDPEEVRDVDVEFRSEDEGLFRIDYSFVEGCEDDENFCLELEVQDVFFIQVGDDNTYWGFPIPLQYDGYRLYTEAKDIHNVDDLEIISSDGLVEVDFSDHVLDLSGFKERFVSFGTRKVTIDGNSFPELDKSAILTFYQIDDNYVIYKDGVECPLSICEVISYSGRRLRFEVPGFSTYEIRYEAQEEEEEEETTTGGSAGGGSGGSFTLEKEENVSEKNNSASSSSEVETVEEPEEKLDVDEIINKPNPFATQEEEPKAELIVETLDNDAEKQKNLLMRSIILGIIGLLLGGGLLFYYNKLLKGGDHEE